MCFQQIKEWFKKLMEEKPTPELPVPLANTFLFVEPDDNYLNYGSTVLASIVAANRNSAQTIIEVKGKDATVANVKTQLASLNPMVFTGIGHGNYTTYTVQATEVFLQVGNANVALMKDKVVHLNSCQTGAQLGPAIMSAGALAYVGSNESFWFYVGDDANTTRAVQSPFLCEYQFDVSLLRGKTVGEARADQLAKFDEELTYWVEGGGKNHADAAELARIISMNKGISTFSGEAGVKPSPVGGVATAGITPLSIIVVLAAAIVGYLLLRKK